MHHYTLYLQGVAWSRPVRLDANAAYREYPHSIITDTPIPRAQEMTEHIVLDGGGRRVLRVIRVEGDEVVVEAENRTTTIPFRNAEEVV